MKWDLRIVLAMMLSLLCAGCGNAPVSTQPTTVSAPAPSSSPATCCVISGTVSAEDVPVVNALVDLLGTGQPGHYTFTRGDGSFRLAAPMGAVVLRAGKWGYRTQIVNLVVEGDLNRAVTLQPGDAPTPLAFGKTVSSAVKLDDTICATSDPGVEDGDAGVGLVGPCKTFLLNIPQDGTLVATATWAAQNMYMTMVTASHGKCCSPPLTLRFPVTAGSPIELGVSIHASDMLPLGATAPFELTVTLER